jgi:outer membrane cobalamin receptor
MTHIAAAGTRTIQILTGMLLSVSPLAHAQKPTALDTVVVVASYTRAGDAGRSLETISRADIVRSQARTVAEVLQWRLGVDVDPRSSAQTDISIRGSSPEQVVILVDGIRVSDAQSAHYAMDLAVPLQSISRIEILRGAGSAMYGPDAIGGVINIITDRSTSTLDAELHGGAFGTVGGQLATGRNTGASGTSLSADYEKSDGYRAGTDYRRGQASIGTSRQVGGGLLRSTGALGIRSFGAKDFYGPYNSTERTDVATLGTRWEKELDAWSLSTGLGTRWHSDDYVLIRDKPEVYENIHETWQTSANGVVRRAIGPLSLAVGGDAAHDQLASTRLGGRREWRAASFGEGSLALSRATLNVALRADHASAYGTFVSPSVSGAVKMSELLQLRASAARGFRAPTWTERFYSDPSSVGNPDLHPERFWSGDIGARATVRSVTLDVAGFTRVAEELIDWVRPAGAPTTTLWRATNVGTATYRGIEGSVSYSGSGRVTATAFASGIQLDASQGAALVGKYALRPLTRHVGLRTNLRLTSSLDVNGDIGGAKRLNESGYLTGGTGLRWKHDKMTMAIGVTNLMNANWLDASTQPVAGRAAFVRLSRSWQ